MKAFIYQVAFAPFDCEVPFKDSEVKPLIVNYVADSLSDVLDYASNFEGKIIGCNLVSDCQVCGTITDFE